MSTLAFTLSWLAVKALVTARAAVASWRCGGAPDPESP
jgi:hypothetical protein